MKITKIEINNYKSIQKLEIPLLDLSDLSEYRNNAARFLLGINESGKSNILEAIEALQTEFEGKEFYGISHKTDHPTDQDIRICAHMTPLEEEQRFYRDAISKLFSQYPPQEAFSIRKINKIVTLKQNDEKEAYFEVKMDPNLIEFSDFIITPEKQIVPAKGEINGEQLTLQHLENMVAEHLKENFKNQIPGITFWKPDSKYLFTKPILMKGIIEENSLMPVPLINIFHIYGKMNNLTMGRKEIVEEIKLALRHPSKSSELQRALSTAVSQHIKEVWKDIKIEIEVKIDIEKCVLQVTDFGRDRFFDMEDRSDGFKQFISLLLTLSAQNTGGALKNQIVLLDEPEAHLHPSGARFMRDEILNIGKNNHVFVATHSPSMIDTNCMRRHWIIEKKNSKTEYTEANKYLTDEVISLAFGIDVMKELLPNSVIYVEGDSDKNLIEFFINEFDKDFLRSNKIISLHGADWAKPYAPVLEDFNGYILLDADMKGIQTKKTILSKRSELETRILLLSDLVKDLPNHSTIEDLFPDDIIRSCCNDEKIGLTWPTEKGVIFCIKNHLEKKAKGSPPSTSIAEIKSELASETIDNYSSDKKEKYTKLENLVKKLIEKTQQPDDNGPPA